MVRLYFILTLCFYQLLIAGHGMVLAKDNQQQLQLFIDSKNHELGRPIHAELYAINIDKKLDLINLQPLKSDFGIEVDSSISKYNDNRWPGNHVQQLNLKLYPNTSGEITIPALEFMGHTSNQQLLFIDQGNTSRAKVTISKQRPWQREQIIITVEISTNAASVQLKTGLAPVQNGIEIVSLPFSKEKGNAKRVKKSWAVTALAAGKHIIELPYIKYIESGVIRKRFYLPRLQLDVKALPAYIPATLPVGKVSIHNTFSDKYLLTNNHLAYWNLSLTAPVINSYWLPPVLRQIKSRGNLKILNIKTDRKQHSSAQGLRSSVHYQIAFNSLSNGFIFFPDIKLQYFDPASGQLVSEVFSPPTTLSLHFLLQGIIFLAAIALFSYLAIKILKLLQTYRLKRQAIKSSLRDLQQSQNLSQIRQAIGLFAQAHRWPGQGSLRQWLQCWEKCYQQSNTLLEILDTFSDAYYGNRDADFSILKNELHQLLLNRKRLSGSFASGFKLPIFITKERY